MMRKDLESIANFEAYGTKILPVPAAITDAYGETAKAFYAERSAGDPFYARVLDSYWGWKDQLDTVWSHL